MFLCLTLRISSVWRGGFAVHVVRIIPQRQDRTKEKSVTREACASADVRVQMLAFLSHRHKFVSFSVPDERLAKLAKVSQGQDFFSRSDYLSEGQNLSGSHLQPTGFSVFS